MYTEIPFPPIRELVIDFLRVGHATRMAHGLIEIDMSVPLARIKAHRVTLPVSLTAYFVYCLAHAVDQHKEMHAYRKGRKKLIIFDDVDVNTLLEKRKPDGSLVPVIYIVRGANHKTFAQINHEVQAASQDSLYDDAGVKRRRQLLKLPTFVRSLIGWWVRQDPVRIKQHWGTVGVSNGGAFVNARPSWGISLTFQTCALIIGGIFDRVYWNDGKPEPRPTLALTITVNHDLVDGAPGARFANTLTQLLEGGDGLGDDFLVEALKLRGEQRETL